jgi:DNA mismatch repair ATPase MutS
MFVGALLNGLFLWDISCVLRLSRWRDAVKDDLPYWIDQIGKVDGLISLANHAYNNPDYAYPVISGSVPVFRAENLGHPLLDRKKRVTNDLSMKRGQVIIITGANMAGKSTFLRSVAVNIVLARTGAPVCATVMEMMPHSLFTSMRTTDSLSHNESYFYAELQRLKLLKDRLETGDEIFFVLDEILKGTNSNDKSLGSKLFLKKLIGLGASGLIATHDTSLGEMEKDYPGTVVNKCFEIDIDGDEIYFDYRLRDGITHRMNAALLMRQMGITDE